MQITENEDYLSKQLITYIGNKRKLLSFIGEGVSHVKDRLNKTKLSSFDVFSGSGVVSRYLKQHSNKIIANDLASYSKPINECYLSNISEINQTRLLEVFDWLNDEIEKGLKPDIISELYAPKKLNNIQPNERCFYTPRNAAYIDTVRVLIDKLPNDMQCLFLAPLLALASVHANTSGVFKGFYKNTKTGIGQFGGDGKDALGRILGDINLQLPIFSNFESEYEIYAEDSNELVRRLGEVDLAYLDPPYNQHPYGSNYFMLDIITNYERPEHLSKVSGIPTDWKRSEYNRKAQAFQTLKDLVENINAKFLLISFNSEGFITYNEMLDMLSGITNIITLCS